MRKNFIDFVKIYCESGNGGSGLTHFHREKFINKGGPDGGKGGKGGDIIIKGNSQILTLLSLKYTKVIKAENGKNGGKNNLTGANGCDVIIEVPIGSIIKNEYQKTLFEIIKNNEKKILFKGGKGGLGNWSFRSSQNQTPFYSQKGLLGEKGYIFIELKILADVGLVGFPNVGKSTLINTLSNAKSKIGNYPFTTMTPNLGVIYNNLGSSFIMADIPGIIKGAHKGKGLGLEFLRHIERNSILFFIIPADSNNHLEEYKILIQELMLYNISLLKKKKIISISKSDILDIKSKKKIKENFYGKKILFFSSIKKIGLNMLKKQIWKYLNK